VPIVGVCTLNTSAKDLPKVTLPILLVAIAYVAVKIRAYLGDGAIWPPKIADSAKFATRGKAPALAAPFIGVVFMGEKFIGKYSY